MPGRLDNELTSARERLPSTKPCISLEPGRSLLCSPHSVLLGANTLRPEECCFCDSLLAEISRKMLSLRHHRSIFKSRDIKQHIKNKREATNTSQLTSLHSNLCWADARMVRIQCDEMGACLTAVICVWPKVRSRYGTSQRGHWQGQVSPGRPFTLTAISPSLGAQRHIPLRCQPGSSLKVTSSGA